MKIKCTFLTKYYSHMVSMIYKTKAWYKIVHILKKNDNITSFFFFFIRIWEKLLNPKMKIEVKGGIKKNASTWTLQGRRRIQCNETKIMACLVVWLTFKSFKNFPFDWKKQIKTDFPSVLIKQTFFFWPYNQCLL